MIDVKTFKFLWMPVVCKHFGHKWRRPHVGEPADSRYCKRCGTGRPVKKRKAKS